MGASRIVVGHVRVVKSRGNLVFEKLEVHITHIHSTKTRPKQDVAFQHLPNPTPVIRIGFGEFRGGGRPPVYSTQNATEDVLNA